jgi:transcription initiation factor TFIIIB Brf1 subunit/transcription initiation factor TFIIB
MYWTVSSADSFIYKTTLATYAKIMEELPTHVANTLQMTKSTIRHRLKNLQIRNDITTCILKAATVPVFML